MYNFDVEPVMFMVFVTSRVLERERESAWIIKEWTEKLNSLIRQSYLQQVLEIFSFDFYAFSP